MSVASTHRHSSSSTGAFPQGVQWLREQVCALPAQVRQTVADWWGESQASRRAMRHALGHSVHVADDDDSPQMPATIDETLVIHQPAQSLYNFWRDVENLPTLFRLLDDVDAHDYWRSTWVFRSPARATVACDVEIFEERDGEWLAFHATGGDLAMTGRVLFDSLTPLRTALHVTWHFSPTADDAAVDPQALLGDEFAEQLRADLRAFKRAMETGGLLPVEV